MSFFPIQVYTACVSRPAYLKSGGTKLSLVQPGNYSVNVRATSLAGNGSFTETTYFFMPNRKAGGYRLYFKTCLYKTHALHNSVCLVGTCLWTFVLVLILLERKVEDMLNCPYSLYVQKNYKIMNNQGPF